MKCATSIIAECRAAMVLEHPRLASSRYAEATGTHGHARRQFDQLVMAEAERRFKLEGIALEVGLAGPNTGDPADPSRRKR